MVCCYAVLAIWTRIIWQIGQNTASLIILASQDYLNFYSIYCVQKFHWSWDELFSLLVGNDMLDKSRSREPQEITSLYKLIEWIMSLTLIIFIFRSKWLTIVMSYSHQRYCIVFFIDCCKWNSTSGLETWLLTTTGLICSQINRFQPPGTWKFARKMNVIWQNFTTDRSDAE